MVKKPGGEIRICGDFRMLNKAIQDDKYPLPAIEDLLARLGSNNQYFAKIDLKSAYHQIQLTEESSALTTIITHIGTFRYTRMPFGIKSALATFQRIKNEIYGRRKRVF